MADGRERAAWIHTATTTAISGRLKNPLSIVPERYRPEPPKADPAREEFESQMAWRMLEAGLGQFGGR